MSEECTGCRSLRNQIEDYRVRLISLRVCPDCLVGLQEGETLTEHQEDCISSPNESIREKAWRRRYNRGCVKCGGAVGNDWCDQIVCEGCRVVSLTTITRVIP